MIVNLVWACISTFIATNAIFNVLAITIGVKINFGLLIIRVPAGLCFIVAELIYAGGSGGPGITADSFRRAGSRLS